jgi:hypothetical protein
MTKEQQIKILNNQKASKAQLREALAASLGVEYEQPNKEKEKTLFVQCRDTFLEAYKKHTGIDYSFEAKDGRSLASIIGKLKDRQPSKSDELLHGSFIFLIIKLPDWYKQNAFSLTVINNKFNEIVASITQNGNGQQQTGDSLESKLAQRANSRRFKS